MWYDSTTLWLFKNPTVNISIVLQLTELVCFTQVAEKRFQNFFHKAKHRCQNNYIQSHPSAKAKLTVSVSHRGRHEVIRKRGSDMEGLLVQYAGTPHRQALGPGLEGLSEHSQDMDLQCKGM